MQQLPWDGWYHCMGNTYGTWLRGDDRGWRARHHREHVQGDYKHPPPPGQYEKQKQQSQSAMKRPPVHFTEAQRQIVCDALVEKLERDDVEVAACVVTSTHFHLVARFPNYKHPTPESPGMVMPGFPMPGLVNQNRPQRGAPSLDPAPRHYLGRAKKHASHTLREQNLSTPGGAWATRTTAKPIESQTHFEHLVNHYLPNHLPQGVVLQRPAINDTDY